jgi:hypothetical protein
VRPDYAVEVRRGLTDPFRLCEKLGLLKGSKKQSAGVSVCCPAHPERDPSCSITLGPDGTVRVRCFGCDFAGDGLSLIAQTYGLSIRVDFREVLALGAELGGQLALAQEIRDGKPAVDRKPLPPPPPEPERDYPPIDEVRALLEQASPVSADADAWEALRARAIDPWVLDDRKLARVIGANAKLPKWARYGQRTWIETEHRILVPVVDHNGKLRSVRAWRIGEGDTPKRLPPAKCRASALVMANEPARSMLRGASCPVDLVIAEGEPDYVTTATSWDCAVIGIVSGSWGPDFARRIPPRTEVHIVTHRDDAGDRYAEAIASSLGERCPVRRLVA